MDQRIEITIEEDGTITTEVKGVEGPSCEGLAAWLASLGEVEDEGRTRDYHRGGRQAVRETVTR